MAIVKFAVVKGREVGGSLDYITQDNKTLAELKTGISCQVETAGDEMLAIQKAYGKTDGRRLVHIIQSFHPKDPVTLDQAHKIGLEFAALWPDYQIVLATHRDTDHIHNHFVMNSVRMSDGKKFHQSNKELEQVKIFSNKLCAANGLKVCPLKNPNNTSSISKEEYQVAVKGNSWKMQLLNVIDNAMKKSDSREEFIRNIKAQGYDVRWQDNYKYLTYFCPNNKRCRDIKLHDIRYLKERMECEFEIRRAKTAQRASANAEEFAFAATNRATSATPLSADDRGAVFADTRAVFGDRENITSDKQQASPLGATPDTADWGGFTAAETGALGNQADTSTSQTGWEKEREIYFLGQAPNAERESATELVMATAPDVANSLVGAAIKIGRAVERNQKDAPLTPPTTHIDSKRYKKLAEKKKAQGKKITTAEEDIKLTSQMM